MTCHPRLGALALAVGLVAAPQTARAEPPPNPVIDWAGLVQPAIHSADAPRSGETAHILHTMVMLAVYDAVVAIDGGYHPYATAVQAPEGADVEAAVDTAAFLTARARIATSRYAYLDGTYASYMAGIADGGAKTGGVLVGRQAAEGLLARRMDDGFDAEVRYACSATPTPPGEFEPEGGCPDDTGDPQPADVQVGQIRVFALRRPEMYRVSAPVPMLSSSYLHDFVETRDYGRRDSALRTPEQTDIAHFWSEHPYVHWNRNLIGLARSRALDTLEAARFFAMVHTAVSDAVILGFEAKYRYAAWRPRTAIPRADEDGNPWTPGDATWAPLLAVNHPEFPSGHAFWSGALLGVVATYFGTVDVPWTIVTSKEAVPALMAPERSYKDLVTMLAEIGNSRIWAGLHFREAVAQAELLAARVVKHVTTKHFQPRRAG